MKKIIKILLNLFLIFILTFGLNLTAFAATGDIGDSIIQTLEHDGTDGSQPEIVHISGNYYAAVYKQAISLGILSTFNISSDGSTITEVDTYTFESNSILQPEIVKVEGSNYYAIAYRDNTDDGIMITVEISDTGSITTPYTDSETFDSTLGDYPQMIHVTGDYYAIAYSGSAQNGIIKTYTIDDNDGTISPIDNVTFDSVNKASSTLDIIHIPGTTYIYAIVYGGTDGHGYISTISINSSGIIGATIETREFDSSTGYDPKIVHISGDYYAIAYRGVDFDGFLATITIDSSGDIGNSVIDTLEFTTDGGVGLAPDIIHVQDNVYAVVFQDDSSSDGYVRTFTIGTNGSLPASENDRIDELAYDTGSSGGQEIINVSGNTHAVIYAGTDDDGFITTFSIDSTSSNVPEFSTIVLIIVLILGILFISIRLKKPVTVKP